MRKINEIVIEEPVNTLLCYNNKLSSLVVPEGFDWVVCHHNNIKSLIIPLSVGGIRCDLMNGIEEQYMEDMGMEIIQKK